VLRNFQRRRAELETLADGTPLGRWSHPQWWIDKLRDNYPEQWQEVLQAGLMHPPFTLRVNVRHTEVAGNLARLADAGMDVYSANGCLYCHSQQVRPAYLSTDIAKGLGPRRTVARDYIRSRPVFLGTMRTGPDLTNVGLRYSAEWQHRHLYEPAEVSKGSIMPAFRYLYRMQKIQGAPSADAVQGLTGPHAPKPGYEVVPTGDAKALVAYLLSLKRDYSLPEAPEETLE
jgi:cytochrome c oxidase cbb3-type subunit 2